jgi:DNA-binding CsgD family transcriptional regulator
MVQMDSMAEDGHPVERGPEEDQGPEGWLFLRPSEVPERWRARAVPMSFIPLLPEEAAALTAGEFTDEPDQSGGEEFLKLVARGLSARVIARQLGISPRSVHRRTARLRDTLKVNSTAELAAELSRRGF